MINLPRLARKSKYNKRIEAEKVKLVFDITMLNLFCIFIISQNQTIRKSNYTQLRNLFRAIDREPYLNDPDKMARIEFIEKGLEAILDKKITNQSLIMTYAKGGALSDNEVIDMNDFKDLPTPEVDYINATVSKCLKHLHFNSIVDNLKDLISVYQSTDFRDRDPLLEDFERILGEARNYFRQVKNDNHSSSYFSLQSDIMMKEIEEAHKELSNPSNKLLTGMQGFNELLGGGIFLGKGYMVFGLPAEGKSGFLLDICVQIKRYNPYYKTKDPTKKPCVVYISQENSKVETIERLYAISTSSENFINYSPEVIYKQMTTWGRMTITDESPIDLIIIYKEPFTNDTSYFDEVVDDLAEQGYEVIFIGHDYVQRIHCQDKDARGDTRLELGFVTNEEVTFAKNRNIAFMTVGQLNRDATGKIDEGRTKNKVDLVRMVGRSNIGESMLMLNNMDGAFMIAKEFDPIEKRYYLGVQRIKKRFKASDRTYIYQPFAIDCSIRLEEDVNKEPMFRTTMVPKQPGLVIGDNTPIKNGFNLNKVENFDEMSLDTNLESVNDILNAKGVSNISSLAGYTPYPIMIKKPEPIPCPWSIKSKHIETVPWKIVI